MQNFLFQFQTLANNPTVSRKEILILIQQLNQSNVRFTREELVHLFETYHEPINLLHYLVLLGYNLTFEEIFALGNPISILQRPDIEQPRQTLAHYQTKNGFFFSVEEILALGDPVDNDGMSISLYQAQHNCPFTCEEILKLGNKADQIGATIAHWLAYRGRNFTISELLKLDPTAKIKYSLEDMEDKEASDYDRMCFRCSRNTEADFQNQIRPYHQGATVAHLMTRAGHRFTPAEIEQLGNPKDARGLTLQDWMDKVEASTAKEGKPVS